MPTDCDPDAGGFGGKRTMRARSRSTASTAAVPKYVGVSATSSKWYPGALIITRWDPHSGQPLVALPRITGRALGTGSLVVVRLVYPAESRAARSHTIFEGHHRVRPDDPVSAQFCLHRRVCRSQRVGLGLEGPQASAPSFPPAFASTDDRSAECPCFRDPRPSRPLLNPHAVSATSVGPLAHGNPPALNASIQGTAS